MAKRREPRYRARGSKKGSNVFLGQKGKGNRGFDFSEINRQKSLETLAVPTAAKKEEKPIDVKPFTGIPEMQAINQIDYLGLQSVVKGVVGASEHISKPVAGFMINLLLNTPDNFYEAGKRDYSRRERKYTRKQLKVYRDAMSSADIVFFHLNVISKKYSDHSLGNFGSVERHCVKSMEDLIASDLWKGEKSYHGIYLEDPSQIALDKWRKEEIAGKIVQERYKEEFEKIESEILDYNGNKEVEALEEKFKDFKSKEELVGKAKEYLANEQDLTDTQKGFLNKVIELGEWADKLEREMEEEIKDMPDEKGIVSRLSRNLVPNGVIIVGSAEIGDIPGLRTVETYDTSCLYQKK